MIRTEDQLHKSIAKYLGYVLDETFWHHSPNGGKRNLKEAKKFRAMGVKAGFPDLVFILSGGRVSFAEIKPEGKYLSKVQKEVRAELEALGCPYVVVHSIDEMECALREWGLIK